MRRIGDESNHCKVVANLTRQCCEWKSVLTEVFDFARDFNVLIIPNNFFDHALLFNVRHSPLLLS